jgi:hypothetical protein
MEKIMNTLKPFGLLVISLFLLASWMGCGKAENPVAEYFENAELQYEGEIQKENILTALEDILRLPEDELRSRKYKDYTGKDDAWDLSTLIVSHFVPDGKKNLGNNFYKDVKTKEMREKIKQMIAQINESDQE